MSRHPVVEEDLKNIAMADLPWERFRDTTVMVTGAYGFLPAYVVEALLYLNESKDLNITVLANGRNREKAELRFAGYLDRPDLVFVYQDVCVPITLDHDLDFIFHGASLASPKYYGVDPAGVLLPNVLGMYHLLELAREKASKGFLCFSSAEIYGETDHQFIPTPETYRGNLEATDVRSCYAESKRVSETMASVWYYQYRVPGKIIRIFHTYGPGMALDDGRVFADFVSDVVNNQDITMSSDGSAIRTYCYLSDAVVGMLTVLLKGEPGVAYNMGNDQAEMDVKTLAETMATLFPGKNLKVIQASREQKGYIKSQVKRACPDTTRLRALGWDPKIMVKEGFKRTIQSFMDP